MRRVLWSLLPLLGLVGCTHGMGKEKIFNKCYAIPGPQPIREDRGCYSPDPLDYVYFERNGSSMSEKGKATTDLAAKELEKWFRDKVVIEVNTCDLGSEEFNKQLGQRRAQTVADYLISRGVDTARVSTRSYGESKPAVPNDSEDNRAYNRRASFQFVPAQYIPSEIPR